jgi:DNA-binding MarR family transcriptional regulator
MGPPLTATPLTNRPGFLLSRLGFYSAERFAARLSALDLRLAEFGLLSRLGIMDGQSQQQLADALGIHRNPMVALIDGLETKKLVRRRRHPDDRRAHAIHLTARGRSKLTEAQQAADEHDAELLAALTKTESDMLLSLLQIIAVQVANEPAVHPAASRLRT